MGQLRPIRWPSLGLIGVRKDGQSASLSPTALDSACSTTNFMLRRGANRQLFKKKLNRGAAQELPAAKKSCHFIFAPPCRTPMSPKLGHLMGLSCPMLALHWFWFGTSAWCESATFQEKVKQGSWSNQKERHWFCSLSPNLHNF